MPAHTPHTPWTTLILPLPAYCHPMFCQLWIYEKCSNTLLTPCLLPYTYQYCQRTPYISTGTYVHMSLIENKQFLLLIDIPIQDRACQIMIHQVFSLDIPHGNYSAHYDVNARYFGVTKDTTMGLELSTTQFKVCQQANGQFCHISMPFQPLANPPTCIAALYAKSEVSIKSRCSIQLYKVSSTSLPTQITPDAWILATPTSAPTDTIIS